MDEFQIFLNIINEIYNIDKVELLSKTRKREFVELRYACVNLLIKHTNISLDEIADLIKIDRTTTYNAIRLHENSIDFSNTYIDKFKTIDFEFSEKMESPEKLLTRIEKLNQDKKNIEDKIEILETLLNNKLGEINKQKLTTIK